MGIIKNRDGLQNNDHWATPAWLYNMLNELYCFDYDPCPINAGFDGLLTDWGRSNYVNPPYNRFDKPKFIKKAVMEFNKGKKVVMLLPAATGTKDFHLHIAPLCKLRLTWDEWYNQRYTIKENCLVFIQGRLAFEGINSKGKYTTTNKGKHDSMLVIWQQN